MTPNLPARLLLTQFFDAISDAAVYLEAVRDSQHQLVDFRLTAGNEKGGKLIAEGLFQAGWGAQLLGDEPGRQAMFQAQFRQHASLLQTGEVEEFDLLHPGLHQIVRVTRSRLGDGVLVLIKEVAQTGPDESLSLTELLSGILEASLNGIITYEAITDEQGTITDFRFVRLNNAARQMLSLSENVVGKPMIEQIPGVKESGLFDKFVHVVETGHPNRFETPFPAGDRLLWYDMVVVKLGNGFVITFNDITEGKESALLNEQQRLQLDSIMNASLSGVAAFEAIREEGEIVDYTLVRYNSEAARVFGFVGDMRGQRLLPHVPGLVEAGLFSVYRRVTQTGTPERLQIELPAQGGWFDVGVAKFDDGFVTTFNDISQIQEANAEVARQKSLLQSVLDNSLNNVFVYEAIRDDAGGIIDLRLKLANAAAQRDVLNAYDTDPVGKTLLEFLPTSRTTGQFNVYAQVIETGKPVRTEHYYSDVKVWYETAVAKLGDGCVVTGINITQRKQAALEKDRQRTLLDGVLNASQDAILVFEAIREPDGTIRDLRYTHVNSTAHEMFGSPAYDINRTTYLQRYPSAQPNLFMTYCQVIETGEPFHQEIRQQTNQVEKWFDVTAVKLSDGVVVSVRDISSRKQAELRIEEAAAELQTVIDTSQTGIFLFSPARNDAGELVDFRFRVANRRLASYIGQEPDILIGGLGSEWFPGYQKNGLFDAYRRVYETGLQERFDFHYETDGIDAWFDIMATKAGDDVLVTFADYTPLKQLQQQLETLVGDLQRSNQNLEQFAYVASHDLQEPLRKIVGFGDIVQAQYADQLGENGADLIRRMQSAAARMQVLIKDVLTYSRLATKRETTEPVDLNLLVEGVLSDLERALDEKKATVYVDPLPTLHGDASQLRQLFQNLIANALKFTKAEGTPVVRITARQVVGRDTDGLAPVVDASRLYHLIEVSDNGIGFDPQHADRIFQVFQRLHSRTSYEGTGIGLAIVQKVVENHHGYVRAKGVTDGGATFQVLFPVPVVGR